MLQKYYSVESKDKPEIWDKGTQYASDGICFRCKGQETRILKLGAFLPSWSKPFGLIRTLGGIVGTEESFQYLRLNGISEITTEEAIVTFGK